MPQDLSTTRFFFARITEYHGEFEFTTSTLIQCNPGQDIDATADYVLSNFRDENAPVDESGRVSYSCGIDAEVSSYSASPLPPDEVIVLQKHLSTLGMPDL